MAVTLNAKGTSVSTFTVGKNGTSISQTGSITPPAGADLTVSLGTSKNLIIDAGTSGPALITASNSQDLHINPAVGGGQNLIINANKWPTLDGTANQTLVTDGAGNLSFTTLSLLGSPSPATSATIGFAYIPVTTGTPTGTPATMTGYVPIVADSGGNKLWIYINGVWKSTLLA